MNDDSSSDHTDEQAATHAPATPDERVGPSRKSQTLEVCVFIFLILPSMVISYFAVKQPGFGFAPAALGTIFHNLAFISLIAFLAWKSGEGRDRFGWRGGRAAGELFAGVWLFVLMFLASGLVQQFLSSIGIHLPEKGLPSFLTPRSPGDYALAFILVVVVAVSEETIFRGYLIRRLSAATGTRWLGVLLSTLIFTSGHGYEGAVGLGAVFLIGLFLSLVYLWRGSLLAPMVIHFLQDFLGIFVLPLLKGG